MDYLIITNHGQSHRPYRFLSPCLSSPSFRWQQVIVAARTDAEEKVAKAEAALTEARELWAAELAVECKEWEVKVEAGIVYARERQAERDACQVALQECTEQRDTWQREGQAAVAHLQAEYQR